MSKTSDDEPVSSPVVGRIMVRDEYGTIWELLEGDPLYEEALANRDGMVAYLPFVKLARRAGQWGWWSVMEGLEQQYSKPEKPDIGDRLDLDKMPTWSIEQIEEALAKASAWLAYFTERAGWVEAQKAVMEETLRLHRGRIVGKLLEEASGSRELKDVLESKALARSRVLRDGTMKLLELEGEEKLLRRLVEAWNAIYWAVSRQVTLRLGEKETTT